MKLRGSTQFYLKCPLPGPFCGSHPPTTRLGVITIRASVLCYRSGHWWKKVLVSLLDAEGCKTQLTKARGKDLVILIYNRKYVLLWDVLQHSLQVIRNLQLYHGSAAHFMDIHPNPCLWPLSEGWKSLTDLEVMPKSPREAPRSSIYWWKRYCIVQKLERTSGPHKLRS